VRLFASMRHKADAIMASETTPPPKAKYSKYCSHRYPSAQTPTAKCEIVLCLLIFWQLWNMSCIWFWENIFVVSVSGQTFRNWLTLNLWKLTDEIDTRVPLTTQLLTQSRACHGECHCQRWLPVSGDTHQTLAMNWRPIKQTYSEKWFRRRGSECGRTYYRNSQRDVTTAHLRIYQICSCLSD
jgi:hypothetical protein